MNEKHDTRPGIVDRLRATWQYVLPQHTLSRIVHWLTRLRLAAFKNRAINAFIRYYGVDMHEAAKPDPATYTCFNTFFIRELKRSARPLSSDPDAVVSPVDGTISQIGRISAGRILQAKGAYFSVTELLGGEATLASEFTRGVFATLYLAPRDYHRVHMPLTGRLTHMIHMPGRLFSVNPLSTRAIPGLFTRNERVAALFDGAVGCWALVLVGALCVGSIETVWAGEITPPHGRRIRSWLYQGSDSGALILKRGAEMGRFNMGSTVIFLVSEGRMSWSPALAPGARVHLGQALGSTFPSKNTCQD